jgi:hypothetical protein
MQITSFNVHGIAEVTAERDRSGSTLWTTFRFVGDDGVVLTITAFAEDGYVDVIDRTTDDEPDEIEPRGRYEESASYRADMINAGRGHLLGE